MKSKIDIIITSGAISAGKYDFIPSIINKFKLSNFRNKRAKNPAFSFLRSSVEAAPN